MIQLHGLAAVLAVFMAMCVLVLVPPLAVGPAQLRLIPQRRRAKEPKQ
jgi:hypothetical protein